MFSLLKRFFDQHLYYARQTSYAPPTPKLQGWMQTIPCTLCSRHIPAESCFCMYCGSRTELAMSFWRPEPPTIRTTDAITMQPINTIFPKRNLRHRFLNYVRTHRAQVGPATVAHRRQQDLNNVQSQWFLSFYRCPGHTSMLWPGNRSHYFLGQYFLQILLTYPHLSQIVVDNYANLWISSPEILSFYTSFLP